MEVRYQRQLPALHGLPDSANRDVWRLDKRWGKQRVKPRLGDGYSPTSGYPASAQREPTQSSFFARVCAERSLASHSDCRFLQFNQLANHYFGGISVES